MDFSSGWSKTSQQYKLQNANPAQSLTNSPKRDGQAGTDSTPDLTNSKEKDRRGQAVYADKVLSFAPHFSVQFLSAKLCGN